MLGNLYIRIYDISSAISCYKKSVLLERNRLNYKRFEKLLFAKGLIHLEEGIINKDLIKQMKEEMNKTHYYYLKYY